ncbi:MAG TPA: XrtA/PEP-CTERM system histidine kinase PrsK [Aromatoleum sp.]|nr:XrtA/PEP-CTERM system histidine kinase PrsK [Aromatoleum sp.]HJV26847.1 XrtA/PEP-CTERM system histidine kinase PrsK [Aromatoleum sp.]
MTVAIVAYGMAAGAFALLAIQLMRGWRGGLPAGLLLAAVIASGVWATVNTAFSYFRIDWIGQLAWVLDVMRQACWLGFMVVLLQPLGGRKSSWPVIGAMLIVVAECTSIVSAGFGLTFGEFGNGLRLASFLAGAVFGLVLVEQVYRGTPGEFRWGLKPLCLAVGATNVFELYFFADGLLFGRLDVDLWSVRGAASALSLPLIAISAGRIPSWTFKLSVSRVMVFHSTALALSGMYLIVIAAVAYYVRYVGGDWGRALQLVLLFAGVLSLGGLLFSGAQRARLRVLLNKHLFPYRYDYRLEWLRFTQALSEAGGALDLGQSVIKALSDLVESSGGTVWLKDAGGRFTPHARLNQSAIDAMEEEGSAFCHFLDEREWVISLEEYRIRPGYYGALVLPSWLSMIPDAWLILPLKSAGSLVGFVVLNTPRTPFDIDWEVLDLLKTAQRQAASYLARMQAAEALLEARKFDSFNRMTAFVVHDLKNLVAQLSLVLRNADRHKDNPEFQADVLATVAHVEGRMRALMSQLQEKRSIDPPRRVDVAHHLASICLANRHRRPSVELEGQPAAAEVMAHPERLERILGHLVQNALDATPESGRVRVRIEPGRDGFIRIVVEDSGCGMTKDFMRERLFRPFHTNKSGGMGIGVFEAQQYLNELGGGIVYESEPGRGTRVMVTLPAVARDSRPRAESSVLAHGS